MDAPNSISFQQMITTRMSCPDSNNYEQDLLVALEEVTSARPISKNRVDLLDGSNTVVLSLIRTSDK
jgi:heat shock protein HslJ